MRDRSDTHPIFRNDYIGKKIFFPAEQELWTLTQKLNEKQVQYTYYDTLPPEGPSYTCGIFRCERSYPSDQSQTATMKIWMQLPFDGHPHGMAQERSAQPTERLPPVAYYETAGIRLLTIWECKSCPTMLGYKKEWQNGDDLIPGGFVVHMVISDVPGVRLNRTMYQEMSVTEREEICVAFKTAWHDCVIKGLISTYKQDISNLFWDSANKKIYITNFEGWRRARNNERWEDYNFFRWGLK